ncbi:MAG: 6-phosphogluconolactonase [Spirochaetia bacterium]|jgi:6-phosphogluconolactonase|nr:6-phosphogluconolactonase [Spirochaetia bacterium]
MSLELLRFSDEDSWIDAFLATLRGLFRNAIGQGQSVFHMSLSGGSTPGALYKALAADGDCSELSERLEIHCWVGDEREVPADSPQRNGRLIQTILGEPCGWKNPPVLHLWPEGGRINASRAYSEELRRCMGKAPVFDLALLGMGTDGHTAGLFSREDTSGCRTDPLCLPTLAPSEPRLRMTMSAQLLRASRCSLLLLKGEDKAAVVDTLLSSSAWLPVREALSDITKVFLLA